MVTILTGDCRAALKTLESGSVNCCVTSPPCWGLRDYGHDGQIGLEPTPEAYVARMVEVFREVRRVLRDDGTCWVNLGDSYAQSEVRNRNGENDEFHRPCRDGVAQTGRKMQHGLKPKDLVGIPWRVAFALQADGWWLRQDIIWHKPNPMPESVRDRCTKSHEYIFLMAKSERYYYDCGAIKERAERGAARSFFNTGKTAEHQLLRAGSAERAESEWRNKRSVWSVPTAPYREAHFATFPPDLIRPCILAGCPVGGTVLDPFGGSGTTGEVAESLGRNSVLIELNPSYIELQKKRTAQCGLQI